MKKPCRSGKKKNPSSVGAVEGQRRKGGKSSSLWDKISCFERKSKHQMAARLKGYIFDLCVRKKETTGAIRYADIICCGNRMYEIPLKFHSVFYPDSKIFSIHASGVVHCGHLLCPVCSPVLRAYRSHEIETVCKAFPVVQLWTFTLKHDRGQALADLMKLLFDAYRGFWNNWIHPAGNVRSFECTYGNSGWHPHLHVLVFWDAAPDFSFSDAVHRWAAAVDRAGGFADLEHGLTIQDGKAAASYVCKLGVEVTAGANKSGKDFQALLFGRQKALVREYWQAVRGLHFLQFSRGLRSRAGLEMVSDQKIAETPWKVGKTVVPSEVVADFFSECITIDPVLHDFWEKAIRNLDYSIIHRVFSAWVTWKGLPEKYLYGNPFADLCPLPEDAAPAEASPPHASPAPCGGAQTPALRQDASARHADGLP